MAADNHGFRLKPKRGNMKKKKRILVLSCFILFSFMMIGWQLVYLVADASRGPLEGIAEEIPEAGENFEVLLAQEPVQETVPQGLGKPENDEPDWQTLEEEVYPAETETTDGQGEELQDEIQKYVFVGDSRYVGMSKCAGPEDVFISKSNMGHDYLVAQLERIREACDANTALIVGLGVNDVDYNSGKYIDTMNELAQELDCSIYYALVNPVDEEKEEEHGYSIRNRKIDDFNEELTEGLDERIRIIDTNSYLKSKGYSTVDGLHYTAKTYQRIYDYIKSEVLAG